MGIKINGKIFEVGNIDGGRGLRLEKDGEVFPITKITINKYHLTIMWFGEDVEITITKAKL